MLLTSKIVNKTIAKIDRVFTYDGRHITNGKSANFYEFVYKNGNIIGSKYCSIDKTPFGLWCYYIYRQNDKTITSFGEIIKSYHDLRHFIREVTFLSMLNTDLI